MRLDKFLKESRLVKRRSVANEFCDAGCVQLQGRSIKAASEIKVGDELTLLFGNRTLVIRIEAVPTKSVSPQEAQHLYAILHEERKAAPTSQG